MVVDAREYLQRIERNKATIINKQIEKKYWLEMAEGTSVNVGTERVQSSGNPHKMESKVLEAVTIDEQIEKLKQEIADIIHTIERLKPSEYQVLHKIYVQNQSLKEIQAAEGKSYSWVTTTHAKAIKSLQRILDE